MEKPQARKRPWSSLQRTVAPFANRGKDPFYHSSRWKRESLIFREAHPLCAQCKREGFTVPSQVTDHIIPKEICGDPWDRSNWEALCIKHNNLKAAKDKIMIAKFKKK